MLHQLSVAKLQAALMFHPLTLSVRKGLTFAEKNIAHESWIQARSSVGGKRGLEDPPHSEGETRDRAPVPSSWSPAEMSSDSIA